MANVPWCHRCDEPLGMCKCPEDNSAEIAPPPAPERSKEEVGVRALEWHDNTEGPGCPIRFAAWPLHGYRIHLYQYGEADRWAVTFGSAKGVFLPERGDAEFAKQAVETEWHAYLNRAALEPGSLVTAHWHGKPMHMLRFATIVANMPRGSK